MMLQLEKPSPVASRFFAHLMGMPGKQAIRFGDPVGVEDSSELDQVSVGSPADDAPAETVTTIITPTNTAQPFTRTDSIKSIRDWLIDGLGTSRGVLSAWPPATGLKPSASDRALLLDQALVSGHAWWWLHKFRNTLFSRRDSYQHRPNEVFYRLGGEPAGGWNWFPRGTLYGMDTGAIDAFLHFGLSVSVRHFPTAVGAPAVEGQIASVAVSIYLELEAATLGVAPPVFAAMLIFDNDTYSAASEADQNTEATAPAPPVDPVKNTKSGNVLGSVVASQLHTFRLSDMLRTYNELKPEENHLLVQKQIQEATIDLASKIQRLAESKIVKLNMCASNIIFCPHLADSDTGDDWVLLGYGFKTTERELITGKPYLSEYDARMCKRMSGAAEYDSNCAFVLMIAILLAAVRAEFGGAATLMLRALLNQDPEGIPRSDAPTTPLTQAFSAANSKADVFRDVLLRAFQHSRVEREPVPSVIFDEVVADFADTLMQPVVAIGMQTKSGQPPRFHKLVLRLLNMRSYAPCDVATADELAADQVKARKQRQYVTRVIRERQERIRARGNPPVPGA